MEKVAIVTGVLGQLGYYLSELLILKGYHVIGVKRRTTRSDFSRIQHLINTGKLEIVEGDISDPFSVSSLLKKYAVLYPKITIFNAAAQSHVHTSFEQPKYTFDVNFGGVLNILEVMKDFPLTFKLVQCSTSEMYGDNYDIGVSKDGIFETGQLETLYPKYQDENTPFSPMSPYAVSKVAAHQLINNYRKAYGLHASCAIMFNYESCMRGDEFLTQKVCKYVALLKKNTRAGIDTQKLKLGNLNSYRDFTYAGDTAYAVYLMSEQESPDDYVICSGETTKIEDFVDKAFKCIGEDWHNHVEINQSLIRPSEVDYLKGRADKAQKVLGWNRTMDLDTLIKTMVEAAYERVR